MDDLLHDFRTEVPEPSPTARAAARARLDAAIASAGSSRGPWVSRHPRRWAVVAAAAAAAAGTLAVTLPRDHTRPDAAPRTVFGDALVKFPNDTASDVVSYADRVAVVTAVAATEIPDNAPAARAAAGEGTVNRRITFRVDRTLWQRPGAPAAPATFDAVWWGWVMHDHQRSTFVAHGAPWVEIGGQYLMPIAYDEGAVSPLQPFAVFPWRNGTVVPAEGQDTPLAKALAGSSLATVTAAFADAVPDPAAARHMNLPPSKRLDAVLAER